MESEHGSTPTGVLRIHPASSANVDLSTRVKNLRSSSSKSSSSSPDSPFDDPFRDDEYEDNKSSTVKKNVSGSSVPKDEQSTYELPVSTLSPPVASDSHQLNSLDALTTESPFVQVMERSGDPTSRIPSYVFARTKSTAPVDWSVASNESLFSIHMGNMSFSKDPMFWRSGELGLPVEPTPSPQIFNFSPNQLPVNTAINAGKLIEGNVAEAAVETMKEVIRESAEDKSDGKFYLAPSISRRSDASGASVKSFAFPILIGDIGRDGSVKRSGSLMLGPDHFQSQMLPRPQPQPQSQPQPQQQQQQPKPKTPQPAITWTSWTSCFTCCSFRS